MLGEQLGNYRVLRKLGEGGMGVVYVAEHAALGHRVAIKLLLPEMSSNPELTQRFFNEAKAATTIQHPGIVKIFDFGRHSDGAAYFVMELLEGESLASRLAREGRLKAATASGLIKQLAGALAAAHERGIVHRDLKPDNVFLVPDADVLGGERAKILDFGIAKLIEQGSVVKTRVGSLMGTPMYMSPEQCRGAGEVDHRSDIYSLGCIWFEMVCGRPPFQGEGVGELIAAHQYIAPPSPRSIEASVPAVDDERILRTLAKDPSLRPTSMAALAAELGAGVLAVVLAPTLAAANAAGNHPRTTLGNAAGAVSSSPNHEKRWWPFAVVGGVAVMLMVVVLRVTGTGTEEPQPATSPPPAAAIAPPPETAAMATPLASALKADAAPPATVKIHLESEPAGALVKREGVVIGKTPLETSMPVQASNATFTFELAGYEPVTFEHPGDAAVAKRATLVRVPPPSVREQGKARPKRASAPTTSPPPQTPPPDDLYHSR